jgi:carboxyl-terminal processing protease
MNSRFGLRAAWLCSAALITSLLLLAGLSCAQSGQVGNRAATFDEVWSVINESFYDQNFGGHDWAAIGKEFRDRVVNAATEKDFFVGLNAMLFELGVSHIGVIPDDHPEWIGAPATFANGETGLDLRIIDERMVITRRSDKLGNAAPDLKPGTTITRLNGLTVEDFRDEVSEPPVPAIPQIMLLTERAARELYRDAGEEVEIASLDKAGNEQTVSLQAYPRDSAIELLEGIPPVYVDFEARRLPEDIGYVRFNSFHPALTDRILDAIREFNDGDGLIIDVRGNSGGDFNVRRAIAEQLISERALVWRYVGRSGADDIFLEPATDAYHGPVVFIVDELSASSAEELPGAMQALGRAHVVGTRSAGLVLVADVRRLDIGATLVYPHAETRFVDGSVPEGRGITPDVEVAYDESSLRRGVDAQLETAIRLISEEL